MSTNRVETADQLLSLVRDGSITALTEAVQVFRRVNRCREEEAYNFLTEPDLKGRLYRWVNDPEAEANPYLDEIRRAGREVQDILGTPEAAKRIHECVDAWFPLS